MTGFLPPLLSFDAISRADLNRCLVAWEHKMGPWARPEGFPEWFHGLRHSGELVAVCGASALIRERVAGFTREQAVELGRLCACRPGLCRPALRLWREFVFPALCRERGISWVVSYSDVALHSGALYRHDGWVRVGASRSGTDPRGGRGKGRSKVVWGWSGQPALMAPYRKMMKLEEAA